MTTEETATLICELNKVANGKYQIVTYPAGNGLITIEDSTGSFYCRPEHAKVCIEELLINGTSCNAVCSNGVAFGRYIKNPIIPAYHWDDNGVIIENN